MVVPSQCSCLRNRRIPTILRKSVITLTRSHSKALCSGPPTHWNLSELKQSTLKIVGEEHPDLLDVWERGALTIIDRPVNYIERRGEDGYQEPERIYLVGTSHRSPVSASDVRRVANSIKPLENIVVELCRSRSATAVSSPGGRDQSVNPMNLTGPSLLQAYSRSIAMGGVSALILRLLLGNLSQAIGKIVGGANEFQVSAEMADQLGAQLVLGDRPIEITLRRAWENLPLLSKCRLVQDLTSAAARSRLKTDEMQAVLEMVTAESSSGDGDEAENAVSLLFNEMSLRYPELLSPLVYERDLYLAWSLKRSKAVGGTKNVLGVVGRGHVSGICYALTHESASSGLRFRDLAGYDDKNRPKINPVVKFLLETLLFAGVWEAYKHGLFAL